MNLQKFFEVGRGIGGVIQQIPANISLSAQDARCTYNFLIDDPLTSRILGPSYFKFALDSAQIAFANSFVSRSIESYRLALQSL